MNEELSAEKDVAPWRYSGLSVEQSATVRRLLAQAWDEGYQARRGEGWQSPGADNPYRVIPSEKG